MKKPPMRNTNTNLPNPGLFMDLLVERFDLKNDAQLGRALGMQPPHISRIRAGNLPLTAEVILRIHEAGQIDVADIRSMARLPAPTFPEWAEVANRPDKRMRATADDLA